MPELIAPTVRLHAAWLEAHREWGPGVHEDGTGRHESDDVDTADGFARWVRQLLRAEDRSVPPAPGMVHCSYRWIVEDDRVLGAIALRHELNDFLREVAGHIGYGVRPSARRRGVASWALRAMLGEARALGLDRVLVTCTLENVASARTIERGGGVLEDVRDTELGLAKRYWIELRPDLEPAGPVTRLS
jgi:predicted acetyltransferase